MLKKIANMIRPRLIRFVSPHQPSELELVSALAPVSIHPENSLSHDAAFQVSPQATRFEVGRQAGCRRFCSFLVWEGASLIVHPGVYFNSYCSVNCLGRIEIGEGTLFGEGVKFYDHNHRYGWEGGTLHFEKALFTIGEISIGKNCWIGSNVTFLNNVTVGDNCIIGANCLVYKSIPANSMVKHGESLIITSRPD